MTRVRLAVFLSIGLLIGLLATPALPMASGVAPTESNLDVPSTTASHSQPAAYGRWVNITNSSGTPPTPREAYSMAYDPLLGSIVLFGGQSPNGKALGDTWEFSHGLWRNVTSVLRTPSPVARWSGLMVYDPALRGLVLFGGISASGPVNDTWVFNSRGWHNLHLTRSPPSGGNLVYDSTDGYVFFQHIPLRFVGTWSEWKFENRSWTNITSSVIGAIPDLAWFAADDPHDGYVLVYGGYPANGCTGEGLTWSYRNGTFTNLTASQRLTPAAQMGSSAITFDPLAKGVVMTGGYTSSCKVTHQTWLFKNGLWVNLTRAVGNAIPGRWGARMAFDSQMGVDLTFGGNERVYGGSNSFGSDTWKLHL